MRVFLLMLIALTTFTPSILTANDQRPFWTEQSSFTFDDALYAVGVASNAVSVEEARQAAFTNGLDEIRNYAQVDNLNGLLVETQMTFEEPQSDGRVSVWRLLRVSMGELRVLKGTKTQTGVSQVRTTQRLREPQEPRTAAVSKPHTPKTPVRQRTDSVEVPAVTIRQPAVNLPTLPLRYPQVIIGWTRGVAESTQDGHGRIGVEWKERPEWSVSVLKASDLTYARR